MKSCFFVGHADAPEDIFTALLEAVEYHIVKLGVTSFFVGQYGAYDRMAARAVMTAKKKYPDVELTLLLPYHPAERPVEKPEGFDATYYPLGLQNTPNRFAIPKANRLMVGSVDHIIAYVWHSASNAGKVLEYAVAKEKKGTLRICNLARNTRKSSDFE